MNTHSNKLQRMLKSQESVEKINEARQAQEEDVTGLQPDEDDNGPQVVGEATSAMHDVLDLNQQSMIVTMQPLLVSKSWCRH